MEPLDIAPIPGSGAASDHARRLLADLGLPVRAAPGVPDLHPALAWARSGAMFLTGREDALPRVPSGPLASCAEGAGRALRALGASAPADCAALLGERAALAGLARRGAVSAGGACRMLRAADGWGALQLARDEDVRALPAWLEEAAPAGAEPWQWAERAVRGRPLAALCRRAAWLGLPFAPAAAPRTRPWLRVAARGPAGAAPRRAPRVLDLSSLWAGPLAASLLADSGAEVTKVESRRRPDGARRGAPGFFALLNGSKQSAQLDFADRADLRRLRALADRADVVVEASRPRALAQLGLDAEAFVRARPGRIWLSITGYGHADPPPGRIAFGDDAAVAAGCAVAVADEHGPLFCGDAIADPLTGVHAALAVWAHWRRGAGALLDVSLRGVTAFALGAGRVEDYEVLSAPGAARVRAGGPGGGEEPVRAPRARC